MNGLVSIMVAEDEPLARESTVEVLNEKISDLINYIIPVSNGVEALEKLQQFPCDILLSDISMPEMDGIELLEKVDKKYPHIRKIILTGYDDFQYAKNSIKYHAVDYLLKPIDADELINSVRDAAQEIRKIEKENQNAVLMDMHISGKFSFLYTTSIVKDLIVAIKNGNAESAKAINDDLIKYIERESENLSDQQSMAYWIVSIIHSCRGDLITEQMLNAVKKDLENSRDIADIQRSLNGVIQESTTILTEGNKSLIKLNRIKEYISTHYNEEIYLQKLAEIFNLNSTYICELFKESSNQTYSDYLQEVRINKALTLLESTDEKISAIAAMTGYSDANYFTKAFKKVVGLTPNEYRTKMKI